MMGLRPIKMPSAKERVAAELRKAILSRQMKAWHRSLMYLRCR